jgi:ligand-binding sensor domain-containing protein
MWFGTTQGVSRFEITKWRSYSSEDSGVKVNAIDEGEDGALWFGTDTGVRRFQDGVWNTFAVDTTLVGKQVRSVA